MMKRTIEEDLVSNPTERVPVCLCLDTSGSMGTLSGDDIKPTDKTIVLDGKEYTVGTGGRSRISALNEGVNLFFKNVRTDEFARYAADICIVSFHDQAECISEFSEVKDKKDCSLERANSEKTELGMGVNLALDLLEKRKAEYKEFGVDYKQPLLILMTDGEPNGSESELTIAKSRCAELVSKKKLVVIPILIGNEVGKNTLSAFSPKTQPIRIQDVTSFSDFFVWLSQTVSDVAGDTNGKVDISERLESADAFFGKK